MAVDKSYNLIANVVAATAAPTVPLLVNKGYRGIVVVFDMTAVVLTPAITVTIQGHDPESGKYWTILASTAIATAITTVLTVYPGIAATANVSASAVLPPSYRVLIAHGDTDAATYKVTAQLLP